MKRLTMMIVAALALVSVNAFADDGREAPEPKTEGVQLPSVEVLIPTGAGEGLALNRVYPEDDGAVAMVDPASPPDAPPPQVSVAPTVEAPPATVVVVPAAAPLPPTPPRPYDRPLHHRRWHLGFGMGLGVPSGITLGVVFNPWVSWARLQAALADNVLHTGGQLSLQLDPLAVFERLPVGVFGDFQYGGFAKGSIPGHSGSLPTVGYSYESILGGLRLGKPNSFHWNFEFGGSHLNASAGNFASVVNKNGGSSSGLTVGDPKVSGWIAPSFETGFTVVW